MIKVKKIFLNHGFTPIDASVFQENTPITFDCYIQRFHGFVILVESGTLLGGDIYKKLTRFEAKIYVENKQFEQYKHYCRTHTNTLNACIVPSLNEALEHVQALLPTLKLTSNATEPLNAIYTNAKHLLGAWLRENKEKHLPVQALLDLAEALVDVANTHKTTLSSFNEFIDETHSLPAHLTKVAFFVSIVASRIGLDLTDQRDLVFAALVHDIGQTALDEELLQKAGALSEEEFRHVQTHPKESVSLLRKHKVHTRCVLQAVREHHERLDGSGYPYHLTEENLSRFGKILAVCDVFDALITTKPYRPAYSTFNALRLIQSEYKNKLDMRYVKLLIKHLQ
ncbi:MAG: HD domain-containing protein [Campylobacterales bacterium]|nr:HD domain-containing protein [Campylobacterales bacterium]